MKRVFLLMLALAVAAAVLSCAETNDGGASADTPAAETGGGAASADENVPEDQDFFADDLGEFDFEGYIFTIHSRITDWQRGELNVEEITGDVVNDSIYYRNRIVEERFNITFSEVTSDQGAAARRTILAGDNAYDIINTRIPYAFAWAQDGILHPVTSLPYIDLTRPYWHQNVNDSLTVGGRRFFASGAFNLTAYDYTQALLFNKQLVQNLGLDDPYQIVRDGKWTIDKFAQMSLAAQSDLNGNGEVDMDDRHGFLSTSTYVPPAFWISMGVTVINFDENNLPVFGGQEERFINVWGAIMDNIRDNGVWFMPSSPDTAHDPRLFGIFESGRALFLNNIFFTIPRLRAMEIDFGIIPFPKLDERQENYYTRLHWLELFCLPNTASDDDLLRTSVILEALASEAAKMSIPAYYDISLKTQMARDDDSEEMLDILFNTRVLDWGDTVWYNDLRNPIFRAMFERGDRDIVSRMERAENTMNNRIARMIEAFEALD